MGSAYDQCLAHNTPLMGEERKRMEREMAQWMSGEIVEFYLSLLIYR